MHQWRGPSNSASQDLGPRRGVKRWPVVWGWNIGLESTWNSWLRREQKLVIFDKRWGMRKYDRRIWRFSVTKMVYTAMKLIWETTNRSRTRTARQRHSSDRRQAALVNMCWGWLHRIRSLASSGCLAVAVGGWWHSHARGGQFVLRLWWSKQRRTDKWVGRRQRRMGRARTEDNPEPRTRLMNLVMQG